MSYILDALRRADSERERGAVPGIHAQPVPRLSSQAALRTPPPALWIGGASLALLAFVVWQWSSGDAPQPETPRGAMPPAPAPLAPPPAPQVAAAAPAARAETASRGEAGPRDGAPRADAAKPRSDAAPRAEPRPRPEPRSEARARADAPRSAATATRSDAATDPRSPTTDRSPITDHRSPAAPAPPEPRVVALNDLPEAIRRELPRFAIGGSIYSEHPANRFLVINGQTFRERDPITSELTLHRIGPKSAQLDFKGHRFEIAY